MVRNLIRPGDGDPRHGTENGYGNLRCRCAACTDAHRVYHAERVAGTCRGCGGRVADRYVSFRCRNCERAAAEPAHGTESRYMHHRCRCALCRAAATEARRNRRRVAA